MIEQLTTQDVEAACGETNAEKGSIYQEQGCVRSIKWVQSRQQLFGWVKGKGKMPYNQKISIQSSPQGEPTQIKGTCSCPSGKNCEHIAAVLIQWIRTNSHTDPTSQDQENLPVDGKHLTAIRNWQDKIANKKDIYDDQTAADDANQERLLYLLHPTHFQGQAEIAVEVVKARELRKGGWGRPSRYDIASSNHRIMPNFISTLDESILMLLYATSSHMFGYHTPRPLTLNQDYGALIVQRMIETGRCFLKSQEEPPMRWSEDLEAEFSWSEDTEQYQLNIHLDDMENNWICVPTDPPYYIDPDTMTCGKIQQPFKGHLLNHLRELPDIPRPHIKAVSQFIYHDLNARSIDFPVALANKQVSGIPIPKLTFMSDEEAEPYGGYVARLNFIYGECSISPSIENASEPEVFVVHEGEEWHIKRDLDTEAILMDKLREAYMHVWQETEDGMDWICDANSRHEIALQWHAIIEELTPLWRKSGWLIEFDSSFNLRFSRASNFSGSLTDRDSQFDIGIQVHVNNKKLALLPLIIEWLEGQPDNTQGAMAVELADDEWLTVPSRVIRPILDTLVELNDRPDLNEKGQLSLPQQQASRLLSIEDALSRGRDTMKWEGGKKLQALGSKLRNFSGIKDVNPPKGLKAELRKYQHQGVSWLSFLVEFQFGGILADDMGLGKTLQTLTHLLRMKESRKLKDPALIVAPTSLLGNWVREAQKFTPQLKTVISHGSQRFEVLEDLEKYDIIITSYALMVRDLDLLNEHSFQIVILDEAQAIKNPKSKAAIAAGKVNARNRLCLTGTPLENHLGELWSLFNFLMPGFLGTGQQFNQLFRKPIENKGHHSRQTELNERVRPFMLRRTKQQVASELPPKTEIIQSIEMDNKQSKLYETIRISMEKKVRQLLDQKGLARSHIEVLDALLKMRQACCDPRLVKLDAAKRVKSSAKLECLMDMVPELLAEGRKILIFSQFTSMLSLIEAELKALDIDYSKLTGQTRKREEAINKFQEGDAPIFLISLKAGGFGLNLTAADTVIHYDPWWNPAVENQATDRAYRIGQDKPVFVYKMVVEGSVEEKILELQEHKQKLADAVYDKDGKTALNLSAEQILELFSKN